MIGDPVDLAGDQVDGNILYLFCGDAAIDGAGFYAGAFQDDGACCNDGIAADFRIVHNDGSHADQYFIADCASVYDGIMTDGDTAADNGLGLLVGGMDHHAILYIYFAADPDAIDIAAYYSVEPYAGIVSNFHVTDDSGVGCDKTIFTKLRVYPFYR